MASTCLGEARRAQAKTARGGWGHQSRFEDKKGEEELYMQAEKNMTTLVKNDRTTTILRNDTLNITGDQFIRIHGGRPCSAALDLATSAGPAHGKPVATAGTGTLCSSP